MKLVGKNLEISKSEARIVKFSDFIRGQQFEFSRVIKNYDFSFRDIDVFISSLNENSEEINEKLAVYNETLYNITSGKIKSLHELIGDHASILSVVSSPVKEFIMPVNWYHDALIEIAGLDKEILLKNIALGRNSNEYLEKSRFQLEEGFERLRASVIDPLYAKAAIKHFYQAKKWLDSENMPSPYLFFCMGLCKFYFEFSFNEAITLFEQAAFDSKFKKGNEKFVAACNYELGKLHFLIGDTSQAVMYLRSAFSICPDYIEPEFQLLRVLVQVESDKMEIFSILQNLTDFELLYITKILLDDELVCNEAVLTWLCGFVDTAVIDFKAKLDEANEIYGPFLCQDPFVEEYVRIEKVLSYKQYFPIKVATVNLDKLIEDIKIKKYKAESKIADLQEKYLRYTGCTWEGNCAIDNFKNYINKLQENLEKGDTESAIKAEYNFRDLEIEKLDWQEYTNRYKNKYHIVVTETSKKKLKDQIPVLRIERFKSILSDKRNSLSSYCEESIGVFLFLVISSSVISYYFREIKKWVYDKCGDFWSDAFGWILSIMWFVVVGLFIVFLQSCFSIIITSIRYGIVKRKFKGRIKE